MSKKEDKVIDKLSTGNTISYSVDILLIFARLQPRGQKLKTWNQISKKLEKKLSQDEFNTWIRPLQGEFKENSLEISAPNDFVLNYVSNNLKIYNFFSVVKALVLRARINLKKGSGSFHNQNLKRFLKISASKTKKSLKICFSFKSER